VSGVRAWHYTTLGSCPPSECEITTGGLTAGNGPLSLLRQNAMLGPAPHMTPQRSRRYEAAIRKGKNQVELRSRLQLQPSFDGNAGATGFGNASTRLFHSTIPSFATDNFDSFGSSGMMIVLKNLR